MSVQGLEIPALRRPCRTCARAAGACCVDEAGREIDYVHDSRIRDEEKLSGDAVVTGQTREEAE